MKRAESLRGDRRKRAEERDRVNEGEGEQQADESERLVKMKIWPSEG